jgi:hypothetical protein
MKKICLVAILCDEEKFIDEWLVYHRLLGIDHFFLYDDDPSLSLAQFLKPHADQVTVIPWYNRHHSYAGRNRQTKAYLHAVKEFSHEFEWVTFIDGDEFIVLRRHNTIREFLADYEAFSSISLNWHVFGHNGYFDDPPGLITELLVRRKAAPSRHVKSITRTQAIADIQSAHFCKLKSGRMGDANKRIFRDALYEGKTNIAHINHYQCRSFTRWMSRTKRGCVTIDPLNPASDDNQWRIDEQACLKQFVTTIALDKNELIDEYMKKYTGQILAALNQFDRPALDVEQAAKIF